MSLLLREQLARMSLEVAQLVADGFDTTHILAQADLIPQELEEIFNSLEFEEALKAKGDTVYDTWKDQRAEELVGSLRRTLSENLRFYYSELNRLATDGSGIAPKQRADILLALTKLAPPPEEMATQRVRLPPALIENWAKRHAHHQALIRERKRERKQSEQRGVGPTSGPAQRKQRGPDPPGSPKVFPGKPLLPLWGHAPNDRSDRGSA